ncbi:MAG TPA: phosphate ABC transporter substrate-binding protein PstS [Kineosporiaceae bacterium]|nr:phosphate ABC transporter substrate-binding protein PstS [Kineosporiaceae bacterium]
MKISRSARLGGMALVGALALAACGSDNNSGSSTGSAGGSSSSSGAALSGSLNGEGSTAQKNAIDEVVATFSQANPNAKVSYNATGSGAGIKSFTGGQVDWAGSDSALKTDPGDGGAVSEVDAAKKRCGGNDAWNLPLVAGPIAVAYNLQGVDTVVLTPSLVAKIFQGTITTWNDPAIKAVNSGVDLPDQKITVFYRSDESGTTENFEKYLAGAAPQDFTAKPSKKWAGTVGQGAAKSSGVAQGVKSTPGGIGYVEWSNAKDNNLGVAQIDNGGGAVELTAESAGKALEAAKPDGQGNDLRLKLDYATKQAGVYPIVLVTYEIVCSKGTDAAKLPLVKGFLTYLAQAKTQQDLAGIGYAQVPDSVLQKATTAINAIS